MEEMNSKDWSQPVKARDILNPLVCQFKSSTIPSIGENVRQPEQLNTTGGNLSYFKHFEKKNGII